jgi:hypothetical protein
MAYGAVPVLLKEFGSRQEHLSANFSHRSFEAKRKPCSAFVLKLYKLGMDLDSIMTQAIVV